MNTPTPEQVAGAHRMREIFSQCWNEADAGVGLDWDKLDRKTQAAWVLFEGKAREHFLRELLDIIEGVKEAPKATAEF